MYPIDRGLSHLSKPQDLGPGFQLCSFVLFHRFLVLGRS